MNPPSLTNQSNLHLLTIQFQLRYPSMFSRNAISNARKLSSQCVGLMGKLTSTSVFSTCQPASMATRSEKKQGNFGFSKLLHCQGWEAEWWPVWAWRETGWDGGKVRCHPPDKEVQGWSEMADTGNCLWWVYKRFIVCKVVCSKQLTSFQVKKFRLESSSSWRSRRQSASRQTWRGQRETAPGPRRTTRADPWGTARWRWRRPGTSSMSRSPSALPMVSHEMWCQPLLSISGD